MDKWKVLEAAVDTSSPLLYSAYLYSDGKEISTSSVDSYARFRTSFPFKGCVDFKLAEQFLKDFDKGTTKITCEKDKIIIKKENLKTTLALQQFDFPYIYVKNERKIEITQELLTKLKQIGKIGGKNGIIKIKYDGLHYIDQFQYCFIEHPMEIDEPIYFQNKYLKILEEGCTIGFSKGNVVVKYEDGIFVFPEQQTNMLDEKNINRGQRWIRELEQQDSIMTAQQILQIAKEIDVILQNEYEKIVTLKIIGDTVSMIAKSFDGEAIYDNKLENPVDKELETRINLKVLKNLPIDAELKVGKEEFKLFTNGNIKVVTK